MCCDPRYYNKPQVASGYFRIRQGTSLKYPGYLIKHPGTSTKYLKYRGGWVLPGYFRSLGLSFASKMGPDIGFLSWQSPRPVSVTHTETLITFLGLCVHKPELVIWVLDQVPGYFNEVPCLGVHPGSKTELALESHWEQSRALVMLYTGSDERYGSKLSSVIAYECT